MKKWILGVVGLFVAVTLAGCSSSTVANMKGAKVTKDEYYDAMKKTTTGQATLRNMIVLKALEQQYPNKVSDKKVNSQFNTLKKQYGSSFDTTLEQNGYTESSFKDQIRTTLYSEVALKALKSQQKNKLLLSGRSINRRSPCNISWSRPKMKLNKSFPTTKKTQPKRTLRPLPRRTQSILEQKIRAVS